MRSLFEQPHQALSDFNSIEAERRRIQYHLIFLIGAFFLAAFALTNYINLRHETAYFLFGALSLAVLINIFVLKSNSHIAEKIWKTVEDLNLELSLIDEQITISIGLAEYRIGATMLELFDEADTALYLAKRAARTVLEPQKMSDRIGLSPISHWFESIWIGQWVMRAGVLRKRYREALIKASRAVTSSCHRSDWRTSYGHS
jgi:hypothetical protein